MKFARLFAFAALLAAHGVRAATFEEQRAAVAAAVESQPEAAIVSLLRAGIAENRPAGALAETRKWLRQNLPKTETLPYLAGRAAELSGDWAAAAALYQQALGKADPATAQAGDAIIAVHTLLNNQLADTSGAYAFGKKEARRLAVNPAFRQLDRWFLDEAARRGDLEAVATRLLATEKSGIPDDQLVALYDSDFRWLLESIRAVRYDEKSKSFSPEFVSTVKELAAAIGFDQELKMLLDWAVSVKAYNMAKIAGDEAAAPLAEAKALLERYPRHARRVQTDWAGGSNSRYYRDDPKKYWPDELDGKLAPVRAALPKLSPLDQADLLATWSSGFYQSGPELFSVEEARAFVLENPDLVNRKTGPSLALGWNSLDLEEARKLAPLLERNPSPEASLVRAIVAAGEEKNLDKAMDALLGPELWRLDSARLGGTYADQLWHWAGSPGDSAKRDQEIARSKALAARIPEKDVAKEAPANQRIATFRKFWNDFHSARPKIPNVRARLVKVLQVTPEALPQLLNDQSPEARVLVRDVLALGLEDAKGPLSRDDAVRGLSPNRYNPLILRVAERNRGLDWLKENGGEKYTPYPLEPALRQAVADLLKRNKAEPWLTMAWINAQFPEDNAESVKLMEALFKSPVWKTLPPEVHYGARAWFRDKAMTPARFAFVKAADPKLLCSDLLALPEDADPAATTAALGKAIDALRKSPVRFEIVGMEKLAALNDEVFCDPQVLELILDVADSLRSFEPDEVVARRLLMALSNRRDAGMLLRAAAYLWRDIELHNRPLPAMLDLIDSLIDEHPSAANMLARCGLATIERHRSGHTWFKRETDVPRLKAARGKAAIRLGLIEIPVAADDPAYPVYRSQADWMSGNEDSAWDLIDGNWDAFLDVHRDLSVPYLMWALQRVIYGRDEARQEALIKSLLAWTTEAGSPLTAAEKAHIEMAYGDIALQRGQVRQACGIFDRTRKTEDYQGLLVHHQAALRLATAQRIGKDFDAALQTLAELEMERVPEIWTEVRYARAEVNFDMEEYDDAKDDVDSILTREPNHADARILLGKIQLKRQKLMEATEVELGSATSQDSLVPGEKLKVTLSDPTLAVSGAGTDIEVVVWATSGDRERFFLRQFGDQKTKFRGEVATALGPPNPGDDTLQVIGDDEVYYAYSERFREKMNHLAEKRGGPITIASDAVLMASSRKLLTEAEQRSADMQMAMQEIGKTANAESAAKARLAARSLDAGVRAEGAGVSERDFRRFLVNVAKPGNPVHVRVIDPDRSRTAGIDELTVSVSSSSGDSVSRVTLRETGTHTGWFEGSVPTAGAQAMAFAGNSEPGRNPNMVISSNNDYPAWQPVATEGATPDFTVDLNDNVRLGELRITPDKAVGTPTKFLVQTAMNPSDWTTVASYPRGAVAVADPWRPSVTVVNEEGRHAHYGARSVYDFSDLVKHMAVGWLAEPDMATAKNVAGPTEALPASIPTDVKWLRSGRYPNPAVVVRFRAYFNEPESVSRRFALRLGKPKSKVQVRGKEKKQNQPPEFLIAIDGRIITDSEDARLEGELNLKRGIHRFEIWATGWLSNIGFGRDVRLQANLEDADTLVDCPDSFFAPQGFPEDLMDHRNGPASIASDGGGFKVKFGEDSRARLIRLVFVGHEGPVPSLAKLALTTPDGGVVLPVAEDFAALNKNDTLEILTGDRISVRYVDDRFVTKSREKLERFLDVAYTDARAEFADIEPRFDSRQGKDMPYYEKLLRFRYDKPLSLVIDDADMDVSVKPDTVRVTLETAGGGKRKFEAVETGDSTGEFKLVVVPVSGKAEGDHIQVAEGGNITARYLDRENNRPGVPTERMAIIRHASFAKPEILLSNASVSPLETTTTVPLIHGFWRLDEHITEREKAARERIRPRWKIDNTLLPQADAPEGGIAVVHGRPVFIEVVAPQLALGTASTVTVFAQTDEGRRQAAAAKNGAAFDISVPGTIAVTGGLAVPRTVGGSWSGVPSIGIYQGGGVWSREDNAHDDRFKMTLPLIAGVLPDHGYLTDEERKELERLAATSRSAAGMSLRPAGALVVKPGERIHIGFHYTDASGAEQWATASARVITQPAFDLVTEDGRSAMTSAYVGEPLNLRAVDLGADVSDAADTVTALVQAKSGATQKIELNESGPHTGIFKASCPLAYASKPGPLPDGFDVAREGFPVIYGDAVAARYTDGKGVKTDTCFVTISKGADGTIEPFSKQYDDPAIAMRTQFSLAEAYLEMAKRHRKLGETERAGREYASAKLLLSKAMDQFTDRETRAHAEYLLGTLTMEEAVTTEDPATRETRFRAALSRFMNVTGSYPQTLFASKAQYRIATVYEALGEPDIAAQEYVKLAYKYPDSEFLAISMARLGSHFLKKAAAYEKQAEPLLAMPEEDKDARFKGEALQKMAVGEYIKTAGIFARLQERFPGDDLAGAAGLRAGQAYMRAGKSQEALDAFLRVVHEESYDGPKVRAQGLYWAGMCYENLRQEMAAYSTYKRLTYDFPESKWAAYARARLSQDKLLNLENKLELERLEEGR